MRLNRSSYAQLANLRRYANRIGRGTFTIDGKEYHIPLSEAGKTALHGGDDGWDQVRPFS